MMNSPRFAMVGLLVVAAACSDPDPAAEGSAAPPSDASGEFAVVSEIETFEAPTATSAAEPNLFAADDGRVYLTWFERLEDEGYALRFSSMAAGADEADGPGPDSGEGWSESRTIVEGEDFFVNWADFPSIHPLPDGSLAAHWLMRSGPGPVDYDVHLAWSADEGATWGESTVLHRDGTETEHGFVSLFRWDGGGEGGALGAVWLDARNLALAGTGSEDGPRAMSLRFTSATPGGLGEEVLLDDHVCDCCQTSAAVTSRGPVVVYRDRTSDEIRDISIVRHVDGSWTAPAPVHEDGWEIAACPVNGPMVSARGEQVAVAWFTMATGEPEVRLAFSDDAGESFDPPIRIDEGSPVGRVAIDLLPTGEALVSWIEGAGREEASVLVRTISTDGSRSDAVSVATTIPGRSSGFPRMVRTGSDLVFAWTDVSGDEPRLRVARARVESSGPDGREGEHEMEEGAP